MPKRYIKKGGAVALTPSEFRGGTGCPMAGNPIPAGMTGGSGAAENAIRVYGNTDEHHAVTGSNVIAMNNPNTPIVANPAMTGGKRGGRGVLTDVAVPALLLYANNTFRRRKSMRRTRKNRKSRRRGRR